MPNRLKVPNSVALSDWVQLAAADPVKFQERQVTEILLSAIGLTPQLRSSLVLKGGVLMSLAHGSIRQTGDVDFTALADPEPYASGLQAILDQALARAAASLGYLDLVCRIQRFERQPRREGFEERRSPALQLTIGYAARGTSDETRLQRGQALRALQVDISFKDPVVHTAELLFEGERIAIQAYQMEEIIAEKLRALLQQPIRNRKRRQDIYDIDWLVSQYEPGPDSCAAILQSLIIKSQDREVEPHRSAMQNPEVKSRAEAEWDSMKLEIGGHLPPFEEAYARVLAFYESLPWPVEPKS